MSIESIVKQAAVVMIVMAVVSRVQVLSDLVYGK